MKFIHYAGSDRKASVIGAGCMRIAGMDKAACSIFIHGALDCGINFFDHADIYGGGRSEQVFGEVLKEEPSLRDRMFLQSKCGIKKGEYDFSKEYILSSVDGILSRLHTDHLDSLLLHRPDVLIEPEEVNEAFEALKKAGKVLNFGVSNQNPMTMMDLQSGLSQRLCADQVQLSLAHTPMIDGDVNVDMNNAGAEMRDGGILHYCRMHDMAIQIWSPLQIGMFEGVFLNSDRYPALNQILTELAQKYNVTEDAIAYAWLLRIPGKIQVITGTTKVERLRHAAESTEITLSHKEWYDLYTSAGNQLP